MRLSGFIFLLSSLFCACTPSMPRICQNEWQLIEIISPDTMLDMSAPNSGVVINFALDGSLSGYGGCNNFFGEYSLDRDNQIRTLVSGTTMSFCEYQTFEDIYLSLLPNCKSYKIKDGMLHLKDQSSGSTLLYKVKTN